MREVTRAQDARIVGRETELAALGEFVGAGPSGRALVLSGGPGIGKTTLWEAGIAAAREGGGAGGPSIGIFKVGTSTATVTGSMVTSGTPGAGGAGGVGSAGGGFVTVGGTGATGIAEAIYP